MSLVTITDVISAALQDFAKMNKVAADELTLQILYKADEHGHCGTEYYLPAMRHITRAQRNEAIRKEFNGQNLKHVCKKYGIGKSMVYEIVRRVGAEK